MTVVKENRNSVIEAAKPKKGFESSGPAPKKAIQNVSLFSTGSSDESDSIEDLFASAAARKKVDTPQGKHDKGSWI